MTTSVCYYDMRNGWDRFKPYVQHPFFLKYAEIYGWWAMDDNYDIRKTSPICVIYKMISEHVDLTDEEKIEMEELVAAAYENGPDSFQWYCALHDCVESSSLLMAPLACLQMKKSLEELYILNIQFLDIKYDYHQVVSTKAFESEEILDFSVGMTGDAMIFDLIHGSMPTFPKKGLVKVTSCMKVAENNFKMGYDGFFDKK